MVPSTSVPNTAKKGDLALEQKGIGLGMTQRKDITHPRNQLELSKQEDSRKHASTDTLNVLSEAVRHTTKHLRSILNHSNNSE